MPELWVHVGAPVLINSGPFRGFEGAVDAIDPSADAVVVQLELFGRPVPLSFPLSAAGEHLSPFEDQPAVLSCPQADLRQRDLLSQCPEADTTYRTHCWWSTTHALVQVSRTWAAQGLTVRSLDLTWPYREKTEWAVREELLEESEWTTFTGLIERCRFWHLPYDDGRRIPRTGNRWNWRLEGYAAGRYHAVVRASGEPKSEISACCEYLRALALQVKGRS